MTRSIRPPSRFALPLVVGVALLGAGCGSGGAGDEDVTFQAKTAGSPRALSVHIDQLEGQFQQFERGDSDSVRRSIHSYADALEETADALLASDSAGIELRRKAGEAKNNALMIRMEVEPEDLDHLLETAEQFESEPPESGLPTIGARMRVAALERRLGPMAQGKLDVEKLDQLGAATVRLGKIKPPVDEAPLKLFSRAGLLESVGRDRRARELYATLVENFPESEGAPFAAGSIHRIDQKGKVVDDFAGPDLDGKVIDLKDYRGKAVLVDFWSLAPESEDSIKELPLIEAIRKEIDPEGLVVVGVSLSDDPEAVRQIIETMALPWPHIFLKSSTTAHEKSSVAVKYGIAAIPYKLLLDREGRLVAIGHRMQDFRPSLLTLFPDAGKTKAKPKGEVQNAAEGPGEAAPQPATESSRPANQTGPPGRADSTEKTEKTPGPAPTGTP